MSKETLGQRVVVGVDGSEGALAAVRWAAGYARETGMPLHLVYAARVPETASVVLPVPVGLSSAGLRSPKFSSDRLLAVAAAEADRYGPELQVSAGVVSDGPVSALLGASGDASLLVLGSQDRGRVATTLLGSVPTRVVAAAQCPVVVVRGDIEPAGPVVVAVDASDTCEPALRFAFREAARRRCALFAVHAWQPPSLMPTGAGPLAAAAVAGAPAHDELAAAASRILTDALATWRTTFPDVAVHERLLEGPPAMAVADETTGAALAVVGTRGRGPLTGLLLGSTSQALLHRSNCPVAIVRHEVHESPT